MISWRCLLLEMGLAAVLIISPLAFGLVYPWGSMAVSGVVFLLLAFHPEAVTLTVLPKFCVTAFTFVAVLLFLQLCFSSMQKYETGSEILKWCAAGSLFLLAQRLNFLAAKRIMFLIVLIGAAEGVYGFYEIFSGREAVLWHAKEAYRGFVTGTFINRNHLAGFLELCLGVSVGLFAESMSRRQMPRLIGAGAVTACLCTALIGTGSRMGMISVLTAACLMPLVIKRIRRITVLRWGFIGLAIGALYFTWQIFNARFDFTEGLTNFDGGRLAFWKDALRMLKDHIWFGSGLGSFDWILPMYQSEKFLLGWTHAHNDYLELAIEIGGVGILILLAAFSVLMTSLIKKAGSAGAEVFPLLCGCIFSCFAFALHGVCDFNFAIPANIFLLFFVFGLAFRLASLEVSHD